MLQRSHRGGRRQNHLQLLRWAGMVCVTRARDIVRGNEESSAEVRNLQLNRLDLALHRQVQDGDDLSGDGWNWYGGNLRRRIRKAGARRRRKGFRRAYR